MVPFFRSLIFRVGAAIIVIEVAVLAVVGFVYVRSFGAQVDRRILAQVRLPGVLINAGLLRYESVADRRRMAALVEGELEEGMIIGVNGTVFYSLDPEQLGMKVADIPGLDPSLLTNDPVQEEVSWKRRAIECVTPIFGADGVTPRFFAYLRVGTAAARAEKLRLAGLFILGSAVTVLLTSAIIVLSFRSAILTRIQDVAQVLERVELGDLSARVSAPVSGDEIGILQTGVDSTTARLAETIGSLEAEIGERSRAEQRLQASEERYRTLVHSFQDIVYIVDYERRILFANPSFTRISGYSLQEFRDLELVRERIHPDDLARVASFMARFIESDREFSGEIESRFLDRQDRWHWLSSTLTKISYSGTPALQVVVHDITERKAAEEALKTRERYLDTLSQVSLWLVEQRNPADVLDRVVALLGETAAVSRCSLVENADCDGVTIGRRRYEWLSASAAADTRISELGDLAYTEDGLERWTRALARGELVAGPVAELPEPERDHLGRFGIRSVLAVPVTVSGQWSGFLAFEECAADRVWEQEVDLLRVAAAEIAGAQENAALLTEVQSYALQMADRVAERTAELEAVNRELESFAYSVSHDLRAPLRSIDGFSQALLEDQEKHLDETGKDHLRRVRLASQRMGRLIDALLEMSRVARREIRRDTVNLTAVVRAIADELIQAHRRPNIRLEVADGLVAEADPWLVGVVVQNLLDNALKFSSRRDEIRIQVGATMVDGKRVFFVRDNGAGFDMQHADKLFGVFQRLHREREFAGTGIGLATVDRIVTRHGGRIWGESAPDEGATFYFTLSS